MTTSEEDKSIPQDSNPEKDENLTETPVDADPSVKDALETSTEENDSENEDPVDMSDVDRASLAAKIAREMAQIKDMKSAYTAGTIIDLADMTEDSDISTQNTLTEELPDSE